MTNNGMNLSRWKEGGDEMKKKKLCMLSPGTWVTHKKSGLEFEFVEIAKLIGSCDEAIEVAFCKVLPGRNYTSRNLHIVGDHYIFMPREITKKSIHNFDPVDVLADNHCTREEAERYLKNGAAIFTPHDFWESIKDDEELQDDLEVHSIDTVMRRCTNGEHVSDISYGTLKGVPYVIQYVL